MRLADIKIGDHIVDMDEAGAMYDGIVSSIRYGNRRFGFGLVDRAPGSEAFVELHEDYFDVEVI